MKILFHLCIALGMTGLVFICSQLSIHADSTALSPQDSARKREQLLRIANHLDFVRICDTVYVPGERFIEVNLATQHATLRYRNGDTVLVPISSGRITNDGGILTPTGIFSIQSKTREAISRQFGDTKMLWWIGFNYNVGFHGLEVNSYYRHLGVRPSSHGCVRTGREAVEDLYKRVSEGDPVIVHEGNPARILAFTDTARFDTNKAFALGSRTKITGKLMEERLQLLYTGERIARQNFSVFIPLAKQLRPGGYAVGFRDSLTMPQQRPITIAGRSIAFPQDYFQRSAALWSNQADIAPSSPGVQERVEKPDSTANAHKTKPLKKHKSRALPKVHSTR